MKLKYGIDLIVEAGRVLRFGLVGIVATLVYIMAALFADEVLIVTPVVGAIIGQAASSAVSYFGHLHFSFKVKSDHRVFLWRFVLLSLVVLVLNVGLSWLLTHVFGASHRVAIAAVAVLIPVTNYLCNRFWVFLPGFQKTTELVESMLGSPHNSNGGV